MLDAVRATRRLVPTAGRSYALWRISQGGHAALFGGLLAPSYAPELDLSGVAVDAPAVQLANLLDLNLRRPIGKVLTSFALVSWSTVYPNVSLSRAIRPIAQGTVRAIARRCSNSREELALDRVEAAVLGAMHFI